MTSPKASVLLWTSSASHRAGSSTSMLTGEVCFEARPQEGARLRSGRRLGGHRMPTVMEKNCRADSDDDEDAAALNDTWAPRIARRGLPRRVSHEKQPSPGQPRRAREPAPVIAKKTTTPPRLSPVALTRSGASDLFSSMELFAPPASLHADMSITGSLTRPAAAPAFAPYLTEPADPASVASVAMSGLESAARDATELPPALPEQPVQPVVAVADEAADDA